MKSSTPFDKKTYVCKSFIRETFKNLAGLTRVDYFLAAKRLLDVKEGLGVPSVTIRGCKNPKVTTLKFWYNFRK